MSDPSPDYGRALYPFLYAPETDGEGAIERLLAAVRSSTLAKCAEVVSLRDEMLEEYEEQLLLVANEMAERFTRGGKLLAFGNGGSATDADDVATDCLTPPDREWRPIPAVSLSADSAVVTALTNDVGFTHVFSRQVAALAEPSDIALGFSTSGNSENVVTALTHARRRGLLTIAFCGYDGGALARPDVVHHCFIARREFVPRIQEGHATLWHTLLALTHAALAVREECRA